MENKAGNTGTFRVAAIAALLAIALGAGIGYGLMFATGSSVLGICMASPIALLVNNFVRGMLRNGKE